jgi:hypothetical protein
MASPEFTKGTHLADRSLKPIEASGFGISSKKPKHNGVTGHV